VGWFDSIEHNRWLSANMQALVEEAEGSIVPTGFAHLDADGKADLSRSIDLAVTGRMAYIFSLGVLMGLPGTRRYVDHAVTALTKYFTDPVNGGMWYQIKAEPDAEGRGIPWDEASRVKSQYHTVYALLGVAAATVANRPGAHELLETMLQEQKDYWIDDYGLVWDQYDEAFTEPAPVHALGTLIHTIEAYMAAAEATTEPAPVHALGTLIHTIEAYMAAAEATTEPEWLDRAEKMTAFAHKVASKNKWRIPEYFDEEWQPSPAVGKLCNDGRRYHEGYVTGHSMQLARFALQVRAGLRSMGWTVPDYLLELGTELFERARVDGWRRTDGAPGFSTGVNDQGDPVPGEDEHQQWVVCEGVCATVAVRRAMLDDGHRISEVEHFEHCYRSFIDYIHDYLIPQPGRWIRRLGPHNESVQPAKSSRWDVYHAIQAMLAIRVPLWPPTAPALSRGLLDHPEEPAPDKKSWNFFGLRG